jgi:hypothetical protein
MDSVERVGAGEDGEGAQGLRRFVGGGFGGEDGGDVAFAGQRENGVDLMVRTGRA